MKIVKLFIAMMSFTTVFQGYDCYVDFSPANVLWLFLSSHILMFYVMVFVVDVMLELR